MDFTVYKNNTISEVFISLLQQGKEVKIPVYGLSMFPFYLPGDIVRVSKVSFKELRKGDVVIFKSGNKLVAHRLLKIDKKNNILICKGDGLVRKDGVVVYKDLLGVVGEHIRQNKTLKSFQFGKRVVAIVSPVIGLIFYITARIWNKYWQ